MTEKTYTVRTEIQTATGTQRQSFHGQTEDQVDGIRQNIRAITPDGATATVKVIEEQR